MFAADCVSADAGATVRAWLDLRPGYMTLQQAAAMAGAARAEDSAQVFAADCVSADAGATVRADLDLAPGYMTLQQARGMGAAGAIALAARALAAAMAGTGIREIWPFLFKGSRVPLRESWCVPHDGRCVV